MGLKVNTREFSAGIAAEKALLATETSKFHRFIALSALTRIVKRTPVDTGRAQGNWQTTIDTPAEGSILLLDKSGNIAIGTGTQTILAAAPLHIIWISNNLAYIERLEDGWSKRAPSGMVGITVAELQNFTRSI